MAKYKDDAMVELIEDIMLGRGRIMRAGSIGKITSVARYNNAESYTIEWIICKHTVSYQDMFDRIGVEFLRPCKSMAKVIYG